MKLYASDASPYARVIRLLWRQLGIEGVEEVMVNPFEQDALLRQANPLGKVPCLITDEASLYDSQVIAHYLDQHWGQGRFHAALADDWGLAVDNALLQGLMDAAVALRVEATRQAEGSRSAFWCQRHRHSLSEGLAKLASSSERWPDTGILSLRLVALLEYLDFRHPELAWRTAQPTLARWLERQTHPSIEATRPR
ncbi:glutathione S-transferase N-terminal domain-containing protein [Ferrimonas balearica]|uniref:glutathione S-transferase N-terminal domain-containing protein n=1 Tax=Ferrimonas balearica TaxID=44012 RepID=UPI001C99E3C5|nr:glutathione S-transferase N-terminal domain-containing protein [Ferrimonas balearica]MBY5993538.1 glutathione S-transferase N-terminal domain-containing protein [Ferrimonas balearica]